VLARQGEFDEAERLARGAMALLEPTDVLNRKAACLLDFAEVLSLSGRSAESAHLVERAIELYRLKENDAGASRAEQRLRESPDARLSR